MVFVWDGPLTSTVPIFILTVQLLSIFVFFYLCVWFAFRKPIRNREAIENHFWMFLFQLCFIRHLLTLRAATFQQTLAKINLLQSRPGIRCMKPYIRIMLSEWPCPRYSKSRIISVSWHSFRQTFSDAKWSFTKYEKLSSLWVQNLKLLGVS